MANNKQELRDAIEAEFSGLEQQDTWNIVPCSHVTGQNKKIHVATWTLKQKRYPDRCI